MNLFFLCSFPSLAEQRPFLPPSFSDTGLDLNTRYQLAHLTADLSLLIEVLKAEPGVSGFPPPLRYRIFPVKAFADASTQTELCLTLVSKDLPAPYENDVITYSDLLPSMPSSPDFSSDQSHYTRTLSPTNYSPSSPHSSHYFH